MELELAALVDHRVASVIAAGVADDAIGIAGKVIDYLALALVAPLSSDYGISRHYVQLQKLRTNRKIATTEISPWRLVYLHAV